MLFYTLDAVQSVDVPFPFGVLGQDVEFDCIGSRLLSFHLLLINRMANFLYGITSRIYFISCILIFSKGTQEIIIQNYTKVY